MRVESQWCPPFVASDMKQKAAVLSLACIGLVSGRHTVAYLRSLLSVVAALLLAILGPPLSYSFQSGAKATGLSVFKVFSPSVGISAILFFALFFEASRLNSKWLRVLLFWTPVTIVSTVGFGLLALFAYAWLHVPKG